MFDRLRQAMNRGVPRALIVLAALVLGAAIFAVGHAATSGIAVLQVRIGGSAAETRVVVELDGATSAKLVSDGAADRQIVLMLSGVKVGDEGPSFGRGAVKSWTLENGQGGARLRIDLAGDSHVTRRFLLPPADGIAAYRYVIDIASAPGAAMTSTAQAPVPPPQIKARFTAPRKALTGRKVIVIDAGHGGRDAGAQGAKGLEKDINLAAALNLAERLERTGRYRVVLTRKTDAYIPLESRVRIAQRADADLFISLHSDSGPEPGVHGVSVYTLSDKASARAAQFVSRDDWFMKASLTGDQGVRDILFDLTQRATRNRSAVFAQTLLTRIEGKAPLLRRSHRDAGFMVLLAPDVPAVLLEMGFVSNRQDEARLRDPASRARLMRAVAEAIDEHFNETLKVAMR